MPGMYGGFGFFKVFQILFFIIFAAAIGIFIAVLTKNASRHRRDDNSPQLTVEATVVTRRTHVWGDHSHTDYYATFQVASGDRMELQIPDNEFGYIVEGDRGRLTFQGSRYLGFERT